MTLRIQRQEQYERSVTFTNSEGKEITETIYQIQNSATHSQKIL